MSQKPRTWKEIVVRAEIVYARGSNTDPPAHCNGVIPRASASPCPVYDAPQLDRPARPHYMSVNPCGN